MDICDINYENGSVINYEKMGLIKISNTCKRAQDDITPVLLSMGIGKPVINKAKTLIATLWTDKR